MANSIMPDATTGGGVIIRDGAGVCLNPVDVHNAYCPPATYVIDCPPTALPSTCDARIEPRQINAIVSELMALAERFDPNGPWSCNSLQNLAAAFNAWIAAHPIPLPAVVDGVSIAGAGTVADPYNVGLVDCGVW